MKYLLYIFLVLATLFTGIYLLPKHTPLFEYYRLRPVFETASITLLIGVLYLYRREKKQTGVMFSRLSQKNFFLDLAIQCGGIYIWEFKDEEFFFEYPVGDQSSRIELEEMWRLIHPDDLTSFKLLRQSLWKADKEVFQCRARFTGSDYEWWEFRFSAMPALDNAERGKDVSGILININDMKKREKELILMRGYEQKFLANMSHEIRTPLNSIVGFSQVLSDHYSNSPETQEFVNIIKSNSNDLLRLVTDVLTLSELDQYEQLPTDPETDLNAICQLASEVAKDNTQKDVEVLFEPERESLLIRSNSERISQVLNNLAHNAAKFTTRGSIRIAYSVLEAEKKIEISVTDTGTGIPKDQQEAVFERFYKMNSFTQGTGLGLPICRSIAEKLGGSLHIDSSYTDGCRMVLTLPLVYAE